MKHLIKTVQLFLFVIFFFPFLCFSQDQNEPSPKNFIIGGEFKVDNFNFDFSNNVIRPYVGFSLNKHFTIGVNFGISQNVDNNYLDYSSNGLPTSIFTTKFRTIQYGLFGRYTINPEKKLSFYVQGAINHNTTKVDLYLFNSNTIDPLENSINSDSENFMSANLALGLKYSISPRFNVLLDFGGLEFDFLSNEPKFNLNPASISPRLEFRF